MPAAYGPTMRLATGWLAIALVIFTIWRPVISIFASTLFGGRQRIRFTWHSTGMDHGIPGTVQDDPYVVTLW